MSEYAKYNLALNLILTTLVFFLVSACSTIEISTNYTRATGDEFVKADCDEGMGNQALTYQSHEVAFVVTVPMRSTAMMFGPPLLPLIPVSRGWDVAVDRVEVRVDFFNKGVAEVMVNFQNWAIQFDDLSFQDGPNRIYDLTKSEYQLTAEQGEIALPPGKSSYLLEFRVRPILQKPESLRLYLGELTVGAKKLSEQSAHFEIEKTTGYRPLVFIRGSSACVDFGENLLKKASM